MLLINIAHGIMVVFGRIDLSDRWFGCWNDIGVALGARLNPRRFLYVICLSVRE